MSGCGCVDMRVCGGAVVENRGSNNHDSDDVRASLASPGPQPSSTRLARAAARLYWRPRSDRGGASLAMADWPCAGGQASGLFPC